MNPFSGQEPQFNHKGQEAYEAWMSKKAPEILAGDVYRKSHSTTSTFDAEVQRKYVTELAEAKAQASLWRSWNPYMSQMLEVERENARLRGQLEGRGQAVPTGWWSSLSSGDKAKIVVACVTGVATLAAAYFDWKWSKRKKRS